MFSPRWRAFVKDQSDGNRNYVLLTRRDFVSTLVAIGSTMAAPLLLGEVGPGSRLLMNFDSGRRSRWLEGEKGGIEVAGRGGLQFSDRLFSLILNEKKLTMSDFHLVSTQDVAEGELSKRIFRYKKEGLEVGVTLEWSARRPEIRKWLEVVNGSGNPMQIAEVNVEVLELDPDTEVDAKKSGVSVERLLARRGDSGLLLLLDFPCCRLRQEKQYIELGYRPHVTLGAGETHRSHAALSTPLDLRVERVPELLRSVISSRFPFPWETPIHVEYPFLNLWMYQLPSNVPPNWKELEASFSPYQGDPRYPFLGVDLEEMKEQFRAAHERGFTHVIPYPYVDRMVPGKGSPEIIQEQVRYAHDLGLKVVPCSALNIMAYWGFNGAIGEDAQILKAQYKQEWFRRNADESNGEDLCTGSPEFMEHATRQAIDFARRFDIDGWLIDGGGVAPCWAKNHGHPPGDESLYSQVQGVTNFYHEVLSVRPGMIGMCNLGFDPLLPQAVDYLHSIYLTDPGNRHITNSLSDLQMLADSRRSQSAKMIERGVPLESNQNVEYYLIRGSVLPDEKVFEYSLLQGLSYTPNLGVAEIDGLFAHIPARSRARAEAFWKQWHSFAQENFQLLRTHRVVADVPRFGGRELYEKCDGKQSLLFAINPSPVPVPHTLKLREAISLGGGEFGVEELYPAERWHPGGRGREWKPEDELHFEGAPNSLVLLRIRPFAEVPMVSGAVAKLESQGGRQELEVRGRTGEEVSVYLDRAVSSVEVIPPLINRVEGRVLAEVVEGTTGVLRVRFPGRPMREFISEWRAVAGSLEEGLSRRWQERLEAPTRTLPARTFQVAVREQKVVEQTYLVPGSNPPQMDTFRMPLHGLNPGHRFLGVRLYNLPPVLERTRLRVRLNRDETAVLAPPRYPPIAAGSDFSGEGISWWYQGEFYLPFAYSNPEVGSVPALEDQLLALPVLANYGGSVQARAWFNGKEIELAKHFMGRLPENDPDRWCYFLNLMSRAVLPQLGDNTLTFWFQWGQT
jgi:hypothetical protein